MVLNVTVSVMRSWSQGQYKPRRENNSQTYVNQWRHANQKVSNKALATIKKLKNQKLAKDDGMTNEMMKIRRKSLEIIKLIQ